MLFSSNRMFGARSKSHAQVEHLASAQSTLDFFIPIENQLPLNYNFPIKSFYNKFTHNKNEELDESCVSCDWSGLLESTSKPKKRSNNLRREKESKHERIELRISTRIYTIIDAIPLQLQCLHNLAQLKRRISLHQHNSLLLSTHNHPITIILASLISNTNRNCNLKCSNSSNPLFLM